MKFIGREKMSNRNLVKVFVGLLLVTLLIPLPCFAVELGDPAWGFTFKLPEGWLHQKTPDVVIIGHNTIAGRILVIPHMESSAQQVRNNMQQGLAEEDIQLYLVSQLRTIGKGAIGGDYNGYYQGQKVKARGIGTILPNGGGAYIIAVGISTEFSSKLSNAGDAIAKSMRLSKADASQVTSYLTGTWKDIRSSGHTIISLSANGTFSYYSDYAASGNFSNSWTGEQTGNWGYSNNNETRGRWEAKGTPKAGTIYYQAQDGSQGTLDYRVLIENGKIYWNEYYFDRKLYSRH